MRRWTVLMFLAGMTGGLPGCALFAPASSKAVVFFDERSATLSAEARGIISDAAQTAAARPNAEVYVIGYADRFGSPDADVTLSRQRAEAVGAQLIADGIPASRIAPEAHGQALQNNPGVESRRVEIELR